MRIAARRLALIVFAAAGVDMIAVIATSYILMSRGPDALGLTGSFLPILLFLLCPILLLDAGVLALRRRSASNPEIAGLGILTISVLVVALMSATEAFVGEPWVEMLFAIAFGWVVISLAAIGSLLVIIVATIRGPRPEPEAPEATTNAPSTRSVDLTP